MPLLKTKNLHVRYGSIQAVRGVDFEVHEGEVVVLLGANGAGKSSTLNAMMGLVPTAQGQVLLNGQDITNQATEKLAKQGITLCPEGRRVFGTLSVAENLLLGAYTVQKKEQMQESLEFVYSLFPILYERQQQYAGTLSGGQQQMLAVARALMCQPRLLLLDEPSLGLAPKIVDEMFQLLLKLKSQGITLTLVEQNVHQALEIADRGYVLSEGQISLSGTAKELSKLSDLKEIYLSVKP